MADTTPTPVDPTTNPEVPPTTTDTVPVSDVEVKPAEIVPSTDPSVALPKDPAISAADVVTTTSSVSPEVNPEVSQPATTVELPTAPLPDESYLEAQAAQQDRWQQAAATNPEGINNNGSVTTDLGGGQKETVNRDGSYSISDANGTTYYDAAGQRTAYTTPTVDGLSITTTTDGIQYTNYSQGPLTTSTITKDGEPISTTVTYDTGPVTLTSTQVAGGDIVTSASTVIEGDKVSGYTIAEAVQVGDGEVITQTTKTPAYEELKQAYDADIAANQALTADALKYKQQLAEGLPPDPTQVSYLSEEVAAVQQADQALYAAEDGLAASSPLYVSPNTDPQVSAPATDSTPILDTEVVPTSISADVDPEIPQTSAEIEVPAAQIATGAQTDQVSAADNPEVPQDAGELPPPIEYTAIDTPTEDPMVLAQAEATVTDVPIADIMVDPTDVPTEQVGDQLVDVTSGEVYNIDPESGFVQSGDQIYISPAEIPVTQQGDYLVDVNTGERLAIDPETGFVQQNGGIYVSPDEIPVDQVGDRLVDVNTGETLGIDPETGFLNVDGVYTSPEDIPVERQGDVLVDANTGQEYPIDPDSGFVSVNGIYTSPEDIPVERQGDVLVDANTGEEYAIDPDSGFVSVDGIYTSPEDLVNKNDGELPEGSLVEFTPEGDVVRSPQELAAQQSQINQAVKNAQAQATLAQQMRQANAGDWRVKLRLAPGANYLYRANDGKGTQAGILQPLAVTDGVVFPYTPQITTAYRANYNSYDLTHSNYRGYFYQSSYVDDIQIQATFTAQDTQEANYLLAVIHFFRSITKMFYGQDALRGAPPPLVFLQGLGQFQFNLHPCVVAQFNYNLPNDVDYIRARSPNVYNTDLLQKRDRQTVSASPFISAWDRLKNAGLSKGALPQRPSVPILGTDSPTYVPTKLDMTIILHPIQTRKQVSSVFENARYNTGDQLKGGFW